MEPGGVSGAQFATSSACLFPFPLCLLRLWAKADTAGREAATVAPAARKARRLLVSWGVSGFISAGYGIAAHLSDKMTGN